MITTTEDKAIWGRWCREARVQDPYWSWDHLELWAPEWRARPLGVRWARGEEVVLHPVLMVPLGGLKGGEGLWDVRTAYDFAGPRYHGRGSEGSLAPFEKDWTTWALDKGVVTEFLRLHPTALTLLPSDAILHERNFVVRLDEPYEAIRSSYHHSFRRGLKKAEERGLEVEVSEAPGKEATTGFVKMYRQAMVALEAPFWFHFRGETLRRLLALPEARLVTVREPGGPPLAMATVLASGTTLFYHLGCSDRERSSLRPNHRLFDALIRLALEEGFETLHLGGGSESLRHFKSHFANDTVPYSVVRRVVNPQAYRELCRANGGDPTGPTFPAYIQALDPREGGDTENG